MAFSRRFLLDNGVPEDKVDAILAERNRTLTDYLPKTDVQAQIDAAVADAQKGFKVDGTQTDEYKSLAKEFNQYKTAQTLTGEYGVKGKFAGIVAGMLEDGKDLAEQIESIKGQYEEYFASAETPAKNTPVYSNSPAHNGDNNTPEDEAFAEALQGFNA